MRNRKALITLLAILVLGIFGIFLYNLPPINEQLAWRIDSWRAQIKYALNPPEESVFVPSEQGDQVESIVEATLESLLPSPTPSPTAIPASPTPTIPGPTQTPLPTATPTLTPTPIPESVELTGITHEYQAWNNCGPANLSMNLSFWDWDGDQYVTEKFLKPNRRDKNVMPYEMVEFVNQETDLKAVWRVGGTLDLLKRLVAGGFPVLIEKGFEGARFDGWMGHYEVIVGYDDVESKFTVYDSFVGPDHAYSIPYDEISFFWTHFNYTYVLIYPPEREAEAMGILGNDAEAYSNYQRAAQTASNEIFTLEGREKAFAWYNRGTNLVYLDDYGGAAAAYDEFFAIYATLSEEERPWRMLWYQTGPYWAYYYTGRHYDVIELATQTIINASEPAIEETWYWRALAKEALGDIDGAIADLEEAVELNQNFDTGWYHLERIRGGG
jgi:hypothetical protein